MKNRIIAMLLVSVMSLGILGGCGTGGTETMNTVSEKDPTDKKEESSEDGITLSLCFHYENGEELLQPIKEEFIEQHPEVADIEYVAMNGMSDEQLVTKLSGGQFEDVILIPSILPASELGNYFAPIGDVKTQAEKYYYGDFKQYDGVNYGVPIGVVYEGLVYNKRVLDECCDGNVPKTLTELKDDLAKIKEKNIVGIWTNAGAKWTMRFWDNLAVTMSGDDDYANKIVTDKTPWADGSYLREVSDLLAEFAQKGYLEPDVVTGDQWDASLTSIGSGQTAFMLTGSWALSQAKAHAEEAGFSPDDIGFIPFPYKDDVSADNKLRMRVAEDLFYGVNKNSEHVDLAIEFCEFFFERCSLGLGMNEIKKDGGQNQPDLMFLQDLDYVETYTSPAKDPAITEMAGVAGIDVYSFDGYLLDYVILPALNGNKPEYDKLNEAWGKNF